MSQNIVDNPHDIRHVHPVVFIGVCVLEDESLNLNQWIKSNIQDATEMVGFGDGESEIELVISANGWVVKATVINSYDRLLGEHLANELLIRSPRWVPAKANGISVPSKVRITYSWRF